MKNLEKDSYRNNCKIKPAPSIRKILFETIAHPLQKHFANENIGKDFVRIFERALEPWAVAQFHVLKGEGT